MCRIRKFLKEAVAVSRIPMDQFTISAIGFITAAGLAFWYQVGNDALTYFQTKTSEEEDLKENMERLLKEIDYLLGIKDDVQNKVLNAPSNMLESYKRWIHRVEEIEKEACALHETYQSRQYEQLKLSINVTKKLDEVICLQGKGDKYM